MSNMTWQVKGFQAPKKLVLAASKLVFWGPKHWEMKGLDPKPFGNEGFRPLGAGSTV